MQILFKKSHASKITRPCQHKSTSLIALKKPFPSADGYAYLPSISYFFRWCGVLFCIAVLFHASLPLYGFPPKNLIVFEQNVLRLLKTGQYTVLTEYFEMYYPLQTANSNTSSKSINSDASGLQKNFPTGDKLIEKIVQELPIIDLKLRILNHAISKKKIENTRHLLHCYMAEQLAFENNHRQAIKEFLQCPSEKCFFFLAQSHEALKQDTLAIKNYREVVSRFPKKKANKTTKTYQEQMKFKQLAIIALAKLYAKQNKFQQSLFYAKQIKAGVKREIALYTAHFGNGKRSLARQALKNIEKDYDKTLVGKAFLENIKRQQ